MLGCAEYNNGDGDAAYLKSFTRLCSEAKVGCDAFFNTSASDSEYGAVYNLTCERGWDSTSSFVYHPDSAVPSPIDDLGGLPCSIDDITYCTIAEGESSCQFDINEGVIPRMSDGSPLYEETSFLGLGFSLRLTPDVRVVAPDQLTYFVADDDFACGADVMGCSEVGLPTLNDDQSRVDSWTTTYLLDAADSYDDILCQQGSCFAMLSTAPKTALTTSKIQLPKLAITAPESALTALTTPAGSVPAAPSFATAVALARAAATPANWIPIAWPRPMTRKMFA